MDKTTVFYQGRDIDSALGYVYWETGSWSAPHLTFLEFIDENG